MLARLKNFYHALFPPKPVTGLMVGSSLKNQGGMISVVNCYQQGGLLDDQIYCVTHIDGGKYERIGLFIQGFLHICWLLITQPTIERVHLHVSERGSFFRKALVQVLAQGFGKVTILHMHGAEFVPFYNELASVFQFWVRYTLNSADAVIALSETWRHSLLEICPEANVVVIYNPCEIQVSGRKPLSVPVNLHIDTNAETANELETNEDPVRFVFLGRLGRRKGAYDLVQAASLVPDHLNIQINMYGDGEIQEIQSLIQHLKVEHRVQVSGWLGSNEKLRVMQMTDVLVLPSYHEGLPMAILEALGWGLPVVATPVGGIAEAVHHGVNGFLVEPGNRTQLSEALSDLASSKPMRERMGKASLTIASHHFALPIVVEQVKTLYDKLNVNQYVYHLPIMGNDNNTLQGVLKNQPTDAQPVGIL